MSAWKLDLYVYGKQVFISTDVQSNWQTWKNSGDVFMKQEYFTLMQRNVYIGIHVFNHLMYIENIQIIYWEDITMHWVIHKELPVFIYWK